MKSRPQNRGLSYYRRSDDKQEASLGQQHGWARVSVGAHNRPVIGA